MVKITLPRNIGKGQYVLSIPSRREAELKKHGEELAGYYDIMEYWNRIPYTDSNKIGRVWLYVCMRSDVAKSKWLDVMLNIR